MKRVLLVGQPNVGKSSILNALTGARVWTSNYPGTTVEITRAKAVIGGEEYEFIDTPGIYNLYPSSIEEEVTERALLSEDYDAVVLVIDATAIERGLLLAVALAELAPPMIVALNFWEEAERKGIYIDVEKLEELLGAPVVKVNPLKRGGLDSLVNRLAEARRPSIRVRYDDHIEEAIEKASRCVGRLRLLSRRGVAARLVEGDPVVCERFCCSDAEEARRQLKEQGHDPYHDVEAARAGVAVRIAAEAVKFEPVIEEALSRLDLALLRNPLAGLAASLALIAALVASIVILGGKLIDVLDAAFSPLLEEAIAASLRLPEPLASIVSASIQALHAQYIAAIPYVFMFYFAVILLEDSGVLSRAVLWLYGFTRSIGLHPKAVVPILLGLGCSVPAVTATRVLPSIPQRMAAVAALAFVPCSSRAAIVFGVAGRTLGAWAPIVIYGLGFVLGLAAAWIVARITGAGEDAVLIEDLPPLRVPRPRSVAVKAWLRLRDFVLVVTPLVVAGAAVYALLDYYGVAGLAASVLSPVAALLGLPKDTMIPLAYGFLQKDLTVAMLATVLGTANFGEALTPKQIMVFTMAATYQVPCIVAALAMLRELGLRRALAMIAGLDLAGLAVAAAYARIA